MVSQDRVARRADTAVICLLAEKQRRSSQAQAKESGERRGKSRFGIWNCFGFLMALFQVVSVMRCVWRL